MHVKPDHFVESFKDSVDPFRDAARHAAYLYNRMDDKMQKARRDLNVLLESLHGGACTASIALDIVEMLKDYPE